MRSAGSITSDKHYWEYTWTGVGVAQTAMGVALAGFKACGFNTHRLALERDWGGSFQRLLRKRQQRR